MVTKHDEDHEDGAEGAAGADGQEGKAPQARTYKQYLSGDWYILGQFTHLKLSIGYYIDSLTICMFCMVTFIASCIHFYAQGYMHDELHDFTDPEVTLSDGSKLTRPGRYYRFFQYLSLFCFSMLGLVISGNLAMTFVFWELVGICSYFLIGFYIERKSASNAANKAFIVNRVGDFGMLERGKPLGLDEFRKRDERNSAAADTVEERHQLWHCGHLRQPRRGHPQHNAHRQTGDDQRPLAGVPNHDQRRHNGDGHARRRDQVAAHRSLGAGQAHQAVDEQRERNDVEDRDQIIHRTTSSDDG